MLNRVPDTVTDTVIAPAGPEATTPGPASGPASGLPRANPARLGALSSSGDAQPRGGSNP